MGKFDKFNEEIDTKAINKELEDIKDNGGLGNNNSELPAGDYTVALEKMVIGECSLNSKSAGAPLLKVDMKVVNGEGKGRHMFMNKVLYAANPTEKWNTAKAIAQMVSWLKTLNSGLDVVFKTYEQFEDLVMDIAEECAGLTFDVSWDADAFIPITINAVYED